MSVTVEVVVVLAVLMVVAEVVVEVVVVTEMPAILDVVDNTTSRSCQIRQCWHAPQETRCAAAADTQISSPNPPPAPQRVRRVSADQGRPLRRAAHSETWPATHLWAASIWVMPRSQPSAQARVAGTVLGCCAKVAAFVCNTTRGWSGSQSGS